MKRFSVVSTCLVVFAGLSAQSSDDKETSQLESLVRLFGNYVTLASKHSQKPDQVTLASKRPQKTEVAPSIMTVVTREDIETFGARDLTDVLQLVPGFQFCLDISALIAVGFRGVNVHESKVLILINGITVNEVGFGTFNFFQMIPASMIQRVEIIRGPGSALYGGFAEMTVINVVTRRAGDEGGQFMTSVDSMSGATGYAVGLDMATNMNHDASLAVSLGLLNGPLSTRTYYDDFGNSMRLNRANANREWEHAMVEARMYDFELTYLHWKSQRMGETGFDRMEFPTPQGLNLERNYTRFDGIRGVYSFKPTDAFNVEMLGEYENGSPANTAQYNAQIRGDQQGPGADCNRSKMELAGTYAFSTFFGKATLAFGAGLDQSWVRNVLSNGDPGLHGEAPGTMVYDRKETSRYYYAQFTQPFKPFELTLGSRYEDTGFGTATAPRVGLTYVDGDFNAKLLYGRAFRIPTPWQSYRFDNPVLLVPETATTAEFELGYKFTPTLVLRGNVFQVKINKPIVAMVNFNYYTNYGRLTTTGFESELQGRFATWGVFSNVSYNKPTGDTTQDFLSQDGDFLGFAKWKTVLGGYIQLGPVMVAPTVINFSSRPYQSAISAQDQLSKTNQNFLHASTDLPALTIVNLTLSWKKIRPGLDMRLMLHNLTNREYLLPQPYYGGQAPFPVNDRKLTIEATWRF